MGRIASMPATSPLEQFVQDYVDLREGAWDQIEPQVYDILLGPEMLRVAFDPEALPEHPQAQLASFGSPALDRMLHDAAARGAFSRLYLLPGNLNPHDLEYRLVRAISLGEGLSLGVDDARPMSFALAVFWFELTFTSDQKEQEILPVAIDMHYCRQQRQIDSLLDFDRLATAPALILPEARRCGVRPPIVQRNSAFCARRRPWPTRGSASWRRAPTGKLRGCCGTTASSGWSWRSRPARGAARE